LLLPLLPATMLFLEQPTATGQLILVGTVSMFPLLRRDGLTVAYWALQIVFLVFWQQFDVNFGRSSGVLFSLIGSAVAHALLEWASTPARYPDLYVLLLTTFCCGHFVLSLCMETIRSFKLLKMNVQEIKTTE